MAAMVEASMLAPEAKAPDNAPVKGSPEKPDPSKPVMIPINKIPYPAKMSFAVYRLVQPGWHQTGMQVSQHFLPKIE